MISTDPWVWLSALLTLAIFSMLLGDNKFFRWAEATYTATVIGHSVVTGLLTLKDRFYPLYTGQKPILIIPLILGITSLFVVWRRYAWVSTVAMALMIGVGTGISIRTLIATDVVGNVRAVISETAKVLEGSPATRLGYFIRIVFTICALLYFLFILVPKEGPGGKFFNYIATIGKYALIVYMGIAIGNTIQQFVGTATVAIDRLISTWLGLS